MSLEAKAEALFAPWKGLDSPGAAVAVVKDGLVVYRKGFGSAQLEYGIPIFDEAEMLELIMTVNAHNQLPLTPNEIRFIGEHPEEVRQIVSIYPPHG